MLLGFESYLAYHVGDTHTYLVVCLCLAGTQGCPQWQPLEDLEAPSVLYTQGMAD